MRDSSVRLVPMTPAQFETYLNQVLPEYAEANVREGRWEPETALDRSRAQLDQLLPQRQATPDHSFWTVEAGAPSTTVGHLWLAVRQPPGGRTAFVYDLAIDPDHRRHGYAAATLRAAEAMAKAAGADRIDLHVFASNVGAVALYERLGYRPASLLMRKPLPAP